MHTLVFVFVPDSEPDIREAIELLMEGSGADPNKEYPEYLETCYCLGNSAFQESVRDIDASPTGVDCAERLQAARDAKDKALERTILRERVLAIRALETQHPAYEQPDPRCFLCKGQGSYMQSRDPAKHHDWWVLGGRWEGYFSTTNGLDPENDPHWGNVAHIRDVPPDTLPGAMVSADGLWYEGSEFATDLLEAHEMRPHEQEENRRWRQEVAALYAGHPDHVVVVVDVHL